MTTTNSTSTVWLDGLTLQVTDVERAQGRLGFGAPGFHVEISTDDVDRLHTELSEAGMRPDGPPEDRHWGERTFDVVDPDGNRIEFAGA